MLDKSGTAVQTMFSDIAGTYDLLNHVLSGNQDVLWRRRAVSRLAPRRGELILDLCCGTGDSSLELRKRQPHCEVIAADFTFAMLARAGDKGVNRLVGADALSMPFADETFDAVTASFGVRNFSDTVTGLQEMRRVLKPGGRIMILEFMRPTSLSLQKAFGASNLMLAPLGRAISGHQSAYNYLPQSIGGFFTRNEFEGLLKKVGLRNVRSFNHSLGIATSFLGHK